MKWVPPSVRRRREAQEAARRRGDSKLVPKAEEMTIRSPDAVKVRFAIKDNITIIQKLNFKQIIGDYRDPEGENGPDYGYLGQQRSIRLSQFWVKHTKRKAFFKWRAGTNQTRRPSAAAASSSGSPPVPNPKLRVAVRAEEEKAAPAAVPLTIRASAAPASTGSPLRQGVKRDESPVNMTSSPSKRTCSLLERLKLGSPLLKGSPPELPMDAKGAPKGNPRERVASKSEAAQAFRLPPPQPMAISPQAGPSRSIG